MDTHPPTVFGLPRSLIALAIALATIFVAIGTVTLAQIEIPTGSTGLLVGLLLLLPVLATETLATVPATVRRVRRR